MLVAEAQTLRILRFAARQKVTAGTVKISVFCNLLTTNPHVRLPPLPVIAV
jgi:hypothetical protein